MGADLAFQTLSLAFSFMLEESQDREVIFGTELVASTCPPPHVLAIVQGICSLPAHVVPHSLTQVPPGSEAPDVP